MKLRHGVRLTALLCGLGLAVLGTACVGLADRYLASLTPGEIQEMNSLDLDLLEYRFAPDARLLKKVEARARELLQGTPPNKEYKAELLGILGTVRSYQSDMEGVAKTVVQIERESTAEPRLYTLKSLLAKDRPAKIRVLSDGLGRTERKGLLLLALAELNFSGGEYRQALASYDEAFLSLAPRYRELYRKYRDLAFQFMDQKTLAAETQDIIAKAELSAADVLLLTLNETRFFDPVTADRHVSAVALASLLEAKGYIREGGLVLDQAMPRKDIAYLLIRVLAFLENYPKLLERYSGTARFGSPSPVPDIAANEYYYNAALVLVEREILDLPDGRHFFPERPMTGARYYEILQKLKSLSGR